jgi:hypothetical protein
VSLWQSFLSCFIQTKFRLLEKLNLFTGLKYLIKMKKLFVFAFIITGLLSGFNSNAQLLKNAKKFVDKQTSGLSEKDATDGIREALV